MCMCDTLHFMGESKCLEISIIMLIIIMTYNILAPDMTPSLYTTICITTIYHGCGQTSCICSINYN